MLYPAGHVATTPYYNPDTPPGIALVSDVPAYTAANPHAFPIVSNHATSSFTILSLNTDSTIWNTDLEFLTLGNDATPFHATRFDWLCLPCLTCLLLPVMGLPQRPFMFWSGNVLSLPLHFTDILRRRTGWSNLFPFCQPGCIHFRRPLFISCAYMLFQ